MRQRDRRKASHFGRTLLAIVLLALAVRCGYVAVAKRGPCRVAYAAAVAVSVPSECLGENGALNDQYWYSTTADLVSHGHFFAAATPDHAALADHPPLEVFVLAGTSFAFEHLPLSHLSATPRTIFGTHFETHVREQRYTMALIGTLVVLLVGLLGRRIGGERVGLIAALIAALYPNMWVTDGLLFAEPVARVCVLGALLVALTCRGRARVGSVLALGMLCGLAGLARQELIMLLPVLALAVAWSVRQLGAKRVVATLLVATGGAALVVGPWVAFNVARFKDPVYISTNDGVTLAGANCDPGYYGATIGLWTGLPCLYTTAQAAKVGDESQVDRAYRKQAFTYMRDHKSRLLPVIAARIGRTWDLYRPADMVSYEQGENKERAVSWAGLVTFYPIALAAAAGAVVLFRQRRRFALWTVCAPCVVATLAVVLASGSVRNRAVSEPSLVILAAIAVVALTDRAVAARRRDPGAA